MKRRFIAFLLALCLGFSVYPSALAAEGFGEEFSTHVKEFQTRIPTNVVQARLAGGTDYLDKYGVTREEIIAELSAHEHDGFYLNTPFVGGDWQSPRGDTSYNHAPGTNCAGFVAYVLRRCGLDSAAVLRTMRSSSRFTLWGSGRPYDGLSSASNYMSLAEKGHIVAYAYPSKAALLAGGKCEKGDIILRFWTDSWGGYDEDNHLMIFWGNTSNEDKVWQNASGRTHIGPMWDGDDSSFIVIKFAPSKPPAPTVAGYNDVYETDWYAQAVKTVKEAGLMNGITSKSFFPKESISRSQLVTTLWRYSGSEPGSASAGFTDVREGHYFWDAVNWAHSAGIVSGYSDDLFCPNQPVTRQEFAAILYRYWTYLGYEGQTTTDLEAFTDKDEVGDYAIPALCWSTETGLINGVTPSTLAPKENTTRAQAALILSRFMELNGSR